VPACTVRTCKGMAGIVSIGVSNGKTFMGARKGQRRRGVHHRWKNPTLADDRACRSEIEFPRALLIVRKFFTDLISSKYGLMTLWTLPTCRLTPTERLLSLSIDSIRLFGFQKMCVSDKIEIDSTFSLPICSFSFSQFTFNPKYRIY
jgi:hypothetical protein